MNTSPRRLSVENMEERTVLSATCCYPYPGCYPAPAPTETAPPAQTQSAAPLPVLMVIANQDFYYREYSETRAALEAAGVPVVVAAAQDAISTPHPNSGQGGDGGLVDPDLAVADADADDYSAIAFVGGWGASSYQYAFQGTYSNPAYNGDDGMQTAVNDLINDFVDQDKYLAGLCHGVSALAWARVNGTSPLAGRRVTTFEGAAPSYTRNGIWTSGGMSRDHVRMNGGTVIAPYAIGNGGTATDDVWIDGKIITGQNYDSATRFGETIARRVTA